MNGGGGYCMERSFLPPLKRPLNKALCTVLFPWGAA